MRQFIKFFFASCLGVLVAFIALIFLFFVFIAALAGSGQQAQPVTDNSVLHLKFDQSLPELTNNTAINPYDIYQTKVLGLSDYKYLLETAAADDHIKGIFIETQSVPLGLANLRDLREELVKFRESGKFVVAYDKFFTQGAYYLATAGDEIYMHPLGMLDLRGFGAQIIFMKDFLDKIGVEMQAVYAGKFKSATEPYRRNDMSPESRLQTRAFLDPIYRTFLGDIAASRQIDTSALRRFVNNYEAVSLEAALKAGIIDGISQRDEVLDNMRQKMGLEKDKKFRLISPADYLTTKPRKSNFSAKNKVAVIYAEGVIVDGKGEPGSVGDEAYVKVIDRLRNDDQVKAVVLRVNSPGGSAMASESIWRALSLVKEAGKPLVVSMGDYAASGGYYIACLADSIFAEDNTLTGSIGVFSVLPNAQNLMNDKLGLHVDTVKTAPFATFPSVYFKMTDAERNLLQSRTNEMYNYFKQHVSDGRKLTMDQVEEIAQGRVWVGGKAVEIGLVDRIGDIEDAVAAAAHMADIADDYHVVEYPKMKEPIVLLIEQLTGGNEEAKQRMVMKEALGELYPLYSFMEEIKASNGAQARLPFVMKVD